MGVVREALRIVSSDGLSGDHHFLLAFRTDAPGVVMPARLRAQYPQEMTIVLQHMFWDLAVDEQRFSVSLRFGGAPEHVEVPFDALTAFADPSAEFGLRFDQVEGTPEEPAGAPAQAPAAQTPGPRPAPAPAPALARSDADDAVSAPAGPRAQSPAARRAPRKGPATRQGPTSVPPAAVRKVVDLASFRKAADRTDDE